MQINLIPKTREQEQRRNQINSIIIMVSVAILVAVGIITAIYYGINASKKSNIKKADSKIEGLRSDIEKYKEVENHVASLVSGSVGIQSILDSRRDLTIVYRHIQALLPRDSWVKDMELNPYMVTFKINAASPSKIAEAIKALENYEAEINLSDNNKEEDNAETKNESDIALKVKMLTSVDVSKFVRVVEENSVYFEATISASISEGIWIKK
jgi:hypothetical protein